MKIGGHVRFFCASDKRVQFVLNSECVENLPFLLVERGLMISKVTDSNLRICGDAAVPFFWGDIPRDGPRRGGKSATLC